MNKAHTPAAESHSPLLVRFVHAASVVELRLEHSLESVGLSLARMRVLHHLVAAGEPLALGEIAERQACVRSNVTQLMDRLERDDLVRRVPDPGDRRSVLAELTGEGRRRYAEGHEALADAEEHLLEGIESRDRDHLRRLVDRLSVECRPCD